MPKKPSERQLENLIALFRAARDELLDTVVNYRGVGTKVYANTILMQVKKQLERLEKQAGVYAGSVIPAEYQRALDEIYAYFRKNNLLMKPPAAFAQLHNDAIYALARDMRYQIGQGLEQVGRRILRYVDSARDNALRASGLRASGEKFASGGTVDRMRENLIAMLRDEGFMTVQYGSGPRAFQVPLDVYAGMVARSTTREAGNIALENQLAANGYDLVEITEHYPTCELCAQFQGRIYSISGKDDRFPPLSRAFAGGYHNIHPNCRHSVVAWVEALKSPEEVSQAVEKSSRPFEDVRNQAEIDLYNRQQAENRRMRRDLYQYERYKMRLGEDAPGSFHEFRRMKKAGGEKWGLLQAQYKGVGYYEKALKNEPAITETVKEVAASVGMTPVGLETRIKSKESFLRKIRSNYDPAGTEYEVKDIIRYTLTSEPGDLVEKVLQSIDGFAQRGYTTSEIKNYWLNKNSPYRGINTIVTAPFGQKFEVQYHTAESFSLKNGKLHELYEKARTIEDKTSEQYIGLNEEMISLSNQLTVPSGIERLRNR